MQTWKKKNLILQRQKNVAEKIDLEKILIEVVIDLKVTQEKVTVVEQSCENVQQQNDVLKTEKK